MGCRAPLLEKRRRRGVVARVRSVHATTGVARASVGRQLLEVGSRVRYNKVTNDKNTCPAAGFVRL